MAAKPSNEAAWLKSGSKALEIGPAPYTTPSKGQLVVKVHVIALNPIDCSIPIIAGIAFPWLKYPLIMGTDISGTVVELGEDVTRFHVGDRVVAMAQGYDKDATGSPEGAFQHYVVIRERFCSPVPETISFADASVTPLGGATAFSGLFGKEYCALQYPTVPAKSNGESFLVWGGSTSVGCNAIQFAVAAGYQVITTASPKNFELVKSLGASHAFDYRSPTVNEDITAILKDTKCAGAIAIGEGSAAPCMDIISAVPSSVGRKFVAQASTPGGPPMKGGLAMVGFVVNLQITNASLAIKSRIRGVSTKFVVSQASDVSLWNALYESFLPVALAKGAFQPAPATEIHGKGLGAITSGLERLKSGVSAKKLVITLE
ncbi:hypothetical protein N0V93_008961 [Gnomoniopsis smithogilvyi]|uniref:Enoyl reductase (ER) domain-containing protein n=1 Tax=Gnomoniopsis smithogilvyi TaxID=1191159 RepID=A0A9W9CTC0_9PEZI|nr:hypothetical protein N0V93_008961 [Gnomoniopsis smithogilvyi]